MSGSGSQARLSTVSADTPCHLCYYFESLWTGANVSTREATFETVAFACHSDHSKMNQSANIFASYPKANMSVGTFGTSCAWIDGRGPESGAGVVLVWLW